MITNELIEKIPTWICDKCGCENNCTINPMLIFKSEVDDPYIKGKCVQCSIVKKRQPEKQTNFLPEKLRHINFNSITEKPDNHAKAIKTLKRIKNAKVWVLVCGKPNTGKTYLFGSAVNQLIEGRVPCYYFSELDYFENDKEINRKIYDAKIIFIDDFGITNLLESSFKKEKMVKLINQLDLGGKIVVFSSLWGIEKLNKRIGSSIAGRMKRNKVYIIKLEHEFH